MARGARIEDPIEAEKYRLRRQKNNDAATRHRERTREMVEIGRHYKEKYAELVNERNNIAGKIAETEEKKAQLLNFLLTHDCVSSKEERSLLLSSISCPCQVPHQGFNGVPQSTIARYADVSSAALQDAQLHFSFDNLCLSSSLSSDSLSDGDFNSSRNDAEFSNLNNTGNFGLGDSDELIDMSSYVGTIEEQNTSVYNPNPADDINATFLEWGELPFDDFF